jgi:hypothetical protein
MTFFSSPLAVRRLIVPMALVSMLAVLAGCASRPAPTEPVSTGRVQAPRYPTSFDCSELETPVQAYVCRDPALAAADIQLNQLWRRQLRSQDQAGRAEFLASHRQWQLSLYSRCRVPPDRPPEEAPLPAPTTACLQQAWAEQTGALQRLPRPFVLVGSAEETAADHPLAAYVAFRTAQSLEPALCADLGTRFDALLAQGGEIDPSRVTGWRVIAGSHSLAQSPLYGRLPDGREINVTTQDAGPYGSYELRATGLVLDGQRVMDDTTVPAWLRDLPNSGGSFSDTSSQTRDYAAIDVFLYQGRAMVLVKQTWGYYASAGRGESPHAALYEIGAQGLQRRCLWRTYTTPPVAQSLRFLPQFKALQELLDNVAGPDSPRLPPNDRRDAGLLFKQAQWTQLNLPLVGLNEAERYGRWPLLRQRHDEALEAVFAWSERNVPCKLLYRRLMPLLPVAHAELQKSFVGTEGLKPDEARAAADLVLMSTLARAAERLQDPAVARPALVGPAYVPRYAVAPVPGALEPNHPYRSLHSALLGRAAPEVITDFMRATWGSAERIGDPSLGRGPAGDTPLMAAVRSPDAVARLIAAGADVNARNDWGKTALMTAAQADQIDSVQRLLQAGADVQARTTPWQADGAGGPDNAEGEQPGWTALLHAAAGAQPDVIEALIAAGAKPSESDARGRMACELIASNPRLDAAQREAVRRRVCVAP